MPTPRKADEQGQASLFLLVGLSVALLAIVLLYMRLGNANDLRDRAQNAADAAALAAAGQAADNAAQKLAEHKLPYGNLYNPVAGRTRAEEYAKSNGAVLADIRASDNDIGTTGDIVRVEVRSAQCQRELEEDGGRHWNDSLCDGTEGEKDIPVHIGNADAIAKVDLPDCAYIFSPDPDDLSIIGVRCGGQTIQGFAHARRLIDVHLTGKEGKYLYEPSSWNQ
ncbi:MAG: pilus assembly protein TadG-related protein [Nocardiopsaceae bacterium]|nr:pilus assembly protein TadG-related protein [Nocardiopsaceae bacterium]